jgi:hypothetical protein
MSLTLTQARTRIRNILDDADDVKWSDDEIDSSLAVALEQALEEAVAAGVSGFEITESFALNSDGYVSLLTQNPLKITNVAMLMGSTRMFVAPSRRRSMLSTATGTSGTLEITYIPKPTFPASDSDVFTYGSTFPNSNTLDQYICFLAASELKIKEGEINPGLEQRKAELSLAVRNTCSNPSTYIMPYSNTYPSYQNRSYFTWILENGYRLRLTCEG